MKAVEVLDIISQASVSQYPNRHQMLIAQTNILAEMLDACRREIDPLPPTHNRSNVVFGHQDPYRH